jgi:diguanylate cyclase (GGDEF)-like protein
VYTRVILRDKAWTLACCLVLAEVALCLILPRSFSATAIGDFTQCFLLLLALCSAFANVRSTERRVRLFWMLLSLGFSLWLVAQLLWSYFEVILRQEVPNPFIGDVVLFVHIVPLMAALAVQPHAEREEQSLRLGGLDFGLLLTWWLYLYVFIVIPWQFVSPNAVAYGRAFDDVDFMGHFVFVAGAAALWLRSTGTWRLIYGTLFGAGLVYALGAMEAGIAIDLGKYHTGSLYDVPLVIAMGWFSGAGSIARHAGAGMESPKAVSERQDLWVSGAATVTILSLPILAGWALYISDAPVPVKNFRVLLTLGIMIVMGTLAWIKQHRLDKELDCANRELREDSVTDLLTGARNRRFLASTIELDVHHVLRSYARGPVVIGKRDRDLVFYLIDTDGFKKINDQYGHAVGDKVLLEVARRISSAIRHSDVLIRWGGDEFLVISRYTDRDEASHLAKRVLNAMASEPFEIEGCLNMQCTCSVGWAVFPWYVREPKAVPYDEVLRLADSALYDAKKGGRNQAVGLLPTREEPATVSEATLAGKGGRLQEQLFARTMNVPGPVAKAEPKLAPVTAGEEQKALPATSHA